MRRTKQEAMETRAAIIDAAERVFHAQGVARTALSDIAREAGVTRGAIYWHFANKTEVFQAMQERVRLPQQAFFESREILSSDNCLDALLATTVEAISRFADDENGQRVYRIMLFRCEYVGDMEAAMTFCRDADDRMKGAIMAIFEQAGHKGEIAPGWTPRMAADAYFCAVVGLFNEWLRHENSFDLVEIGRALLTTLFVSLQNTQRARELSPSRAPVPAFDAGPCGAAAVRGRIRP